MSLQNRFDTDSTVAASPSPWPLVAATIALGGVASLLLSAFLG